MIDAPIEDRHYLTMNALARTLDDVLNGDAVPKTVGFALFVFEFGEEPTSVNYISNAARESMTIALLHWLQSAREKLS